MPAPTGKYYDLIAIAHEKVWNGPVGDTLQSIMREPVPMLNQREPMYDLYYSTPNEYTSKTLIQRHRNLIVFNISPNIPEVSMTAEYDVYARPQFIVTVNGPNEAAVAAYMDQHRSELQRVFDIAERDRITSWAKKNALASLNSEIENKFGIKMYVPKGYKMRNNSIPDFAWMSMDMPTSSQGIIVYEYPYDPDVDINMPYLVYQRGEFVKNIPGPTEGSYMVTSLVFPPMFTAYDISGRVWYELRGFWDVENDYMGGPFVNYTTIDKENNRVISIDYYVFSPHNPKRNFMKQLENMIFNVEI